MSTTISILHNHMKEERLLPIGPAVKGKESSLSVTTCSITVTIPPNEFYYAGAYIYKLLKHSQWNLVSNHKDNTHILHIYRHVDERTLTLLRMKYS